MRIKFHVSKRFDQLNWNLKPKFLGDDVSFEKTTTTNKQKTNFWELGPYTFNIPNVFDDLPAAMEPRLLTRIDVQKFARSAYELGVRYLGGCCGFEPYHIRAIAEEVSRNYIKA